MTLKSNKQPGDNHSSTADRQFHSVKDSKKQQGISNAGGQQSYQTDNKQGNVNRGNQNPNVEGKKHAPKTQKEK